MTNLASNGDADYFTGNKRKAKSPGISTKKAKHENLNEDHHHFHQSDGEEDIATQYYRFQNSPRLNSRDEEVFCICRRPDHGGELMVSCDGCDEWFHFVCMKIDTQDALLIDKFYCKFCEWKEVGETMWKRRCRLSGCRNPIVNNSKYCCRDHGIEYIRLKLYGIQNTYDSRKLDIKRVLEATGGVHLKLMTLGSSFPELSQVTKYFGSHNMELLPQDIQQKLLVINEAMKLLETEREDKDFILQFLAKYKEKVKITNELYTHRMVPSDATSSTSSNTLSNKQTKRKGKQPKVKKYEICLYHGNLQFNNPNSKALEYMTKLVSSTNIQQDFEDEINKIVEEMTKEEENDDEDDDSNNEHHDDEDDDGDGSTCWAPEICTIERKKCIRHNGWWNLLVDKTQKEINEVNKSIESLQLETKTLLRDYSVQVYEQKVE